MSETFITNMGQTQGHGGLQLDEDEFVLDDLIALLRSSEPEPVSGYVHVMNQRQSVTYEPATSRLACAVPNCIYPSLGWCAKQPAQAAFAMHQCALHFRDHHHELLPLGQQQGDYPGVVVRRACKSSSGKPSCSMRNSPVAGFNQPNHY